MNTKGRVGSNVFIALDDNHTNHALRFPLILATASLNTASSIQNRVRILFSILILSLATAVPAQGAAPFISTAMSKAKPITAPLRASANNPNYFTDGSGRAVYLTGSHTWNNFQDWGTNGSIQPLDFAAYVRFLVAHHHNFTLLWATELPAFHNLPTTAVSPPDFSVTPQPW